MSVGTGSTQGRSGMLELLENNRDGRSQEAEGSRRLPPTGKGETEWLEAEEAQGRDVLLMEARVGGGISLLTQHFDLHCYARQAS